MIKDLLNEIYSLKDESRAENNLRFFKTGKGQYGEGDLFLGLTVPQARILTKKYYKETSLDEIEELLKSPYHEIRLCGLLMAVLKYEKGDLESKEKIFNLYLNNITQINNWDLVDLTAPNIVGHYVYHYGDKNVLDKLAGSKHLWSERVSIVSTMYLIKQNDFGYTLKICEKFLEHKHDLIHKATGWMLREAGKRDEKVLENFLNKNAQNMPRTMLRYAIEKFPEPKRKSYLAIKKV